MSRLISICLLAFHPAAAIGQEPRGRVAERKGNEYQAAYAVGEAEAEKQLKEGKATLYRWGTLGHPDEFLDRKTGLPWVRIAAFGDDEIDGRTVGHNDRIRKYIKEVGLPSNSFKRWEKELFDLKGYFESRSKTEKPHRLILGGSAVNSSDGKYRIRLLRTDVHVHKFTLANELCVIVSVDGVDHKALITLYKGDMDFFWGPRESGFAVIRVKKNNGAAYMALDLKRGKWLRGEPVSVRGEPVSVCMPRGGTGYQGDSDRRQLHFPSATITIPVAFPLAFASSELVRPGGLSGLIQGLGSVPQPAAHAASAARVEHVPAGSWARTVPGSRCDVPSGRSRLLSSSGL